ncbi:MAG: T9SS type A sorting domain-containing protein [Bacteroidetes bacterium]|nr:T9SS type A sorting domain-containing protein [Bacteroidota bacterium]
MKIYTLLVLAFFFTLTIANAQIVHENTYSGAAEVSNTGNGYKFYVTDYVNNTVTVYNEDHSLWKTITLPVAGDQYLYDAAYLSAGLFNTDSLLELIMVTYKYISTSDTTGYYVYTTSIVNENGSELLNVPGGDYSLTYTNGSNKTKLLVYIYDFSLSTYIVSTEVYGLPGASSGFNDLGIEGFKAYPVPCADRVNLPLSGHNNSQAELVVSDISGQEYSRSKVPVGASLIQYQADRLPPGTYVYRLETNGKSIPAGKFIKK